MIEVDLPDGSIAEFPDGTPDEVIAGALRKAFPPPPQTVADGRGNRELGYGETALDMLKSAGTGIAQGAIGIAGLPRDLGQWAGETATGFIDGMMGASDEEIAFRRQQANQMQSPISAPSSQGMTQTIEGVTGPMYQPKTTAGQYARTVGEFVPGAMAGPGGMIRRGAMAVAPGVASEAAGQATEGSEWEPYARVGGAILGGVTAASNPSITVGKKTFGSPSPMKQMLKDAPSFDAVGAETKAAYKALDDAKIVFQPDAYRTAVSNMQRDLKKHGMLASDGGNVSAEVNKITSRVNTLNGWTQVDELRKRLGKIAASSNPDMATEAARASIVIRHLDELIDSTKIKSLAGVPRDQIQPMVNGARELGRRNIIAREIEGMRDDSKWYSSGDESGLRNKFSSYGKKKGERLTDAEEKAFLKVVQREGILNGVNAVGGRLGQLILAGAGIGSGGVVVPAALMGAHYAARKGGELYTKKAVSDALKTVLAGREVQAKALAASKAAKGQARGQTLLTTDSGRRSASQEPLMYDANGRAYPYSLLGQ